MNRLSIAALALCAHSAAFSSAQTSLPATSPASRNLPSRAELERRFKDSLTGATLRGSWQMTHNIELADDTPLGAPSAEQYSISSADKLDDERWIITARIQFADKDLQLPVTVRVLWAGETPVITLDDVGLPLLGKYSARVMIHRDFYAGTWFGSNYGGVMSGRICRPAPTSQPVLESQLRSEK